MVNLFLDEVKEFSVGMSCVDFIPVICFSIASIILMRDLYNKMSKGAFALFSAGVIDIAFAGGLKALYKLLYALNICDFTPLSNMFFPVQSIGFLLAGLGILAMLTHKQKETLNSLVVLTPAPFSGTFIFVTFMVAGIGIISTCLSILAKKLNKGWLMILFIITFFACMSMGYLSSRDFAKASLNWIAEGINVLGQGCLLFGCYKLHKAGLKELNLD